MAREVPENLLSQVLHSTAPSAGSMWELQRRLTAQLGLHALLTHALNLKTATPHSIVLRRDIGAVELLEFGLDTLGGGVPSPATDLPATEDSDTPLYNALPFRLTRTMQQLISPLGIAGAFTGAICAAAECLADPAKAPLPLWVDTFARPEAHSADDGPSAGRRDGIVPWSTSGEAAAERMAALSPAILTRAAAVNGKGSTAHVDVHAKVHALIEAATNADTLAAMPSAFQAWL